VNNRKSWVLRNGELIEACWQTVVVGEIIKLENDQFVAVFSSLCSWFTLCSSAVFAVFLLTCVVADCVFEVEHLPVFTVLISRQNILLYGNVQ